MLCYQTEIEHINENKVASTSSGFCWDRLPFAITLCHVYKSSGFSSATSLPPLSLLLVNHPCFFPSLTVVSLSQCQKLQMVSVLALGLWATGLHN